MILIIYYLTLINTKPVSDDFKRLAKNVAKDKQMLFKTFDIENSFKISLNKLQQIGDIENIEKYDVNSDGYLQIDEFGIFME